MFVFFSLRMVFGDGIFCHQQQSGCGGGASVDAKNSDRRINFPGEETIMMTADEEHEHNSMIMILDEVSE